MAESTKMTVAQIEDAIRALGTAESRQAVAELTAVANRAIIELHRVARAESTAHRGQPDWGSWAKLANAVRGSVLQVATVRDALKSLAPEAERALPSEDAQESAE